MSKNPGWYNERRRHSLAARGIETKPLDERYERHKQRRISEMDDRLATAPRTYQELIDQRRDRDEFEEFFMTEDNIWIYDPIEYLEDRYGVPSNVSKSLTMFWKADSRGHQGADKEQLDSFGKAYKRNPERF